MKHGTIEHIEHMAQSVLGDLEALEERTQLRGDHVLSVTRDHAQQLIASIHKHPDWKPPTTDLLDRSCKNCATEAQLLIALKEHEMETVIGKIKDKCLNCTLSGWCPDGYDHWEYVGS